MFLVWSSQLSAEKHHVPPAAELMIDPRVTHFWDPDQRIGAAFSPHIEDLPFPAWDVWMLFAPGIRWEGDAPPEPSWWEHQLGALGKLPDRRLDAERFAAKALELQARSQP